MLSPEDVKPGRVLGLAHHARQVDFAPGELQRSADPVSKQQYGQ
ncbi:hypothetical protein GGU45_002032 [Niabella hirudinis]